MKSRLILIGKFISDSFKSKRTYVLPCILAGVLGALPYFVEQLFICTFVSQILLFYIAFKQRDSQKRTYLPFFWYFLGFYTLLYLFLSELYPYERFGFDEEQAVFIVICSCILIPLLHAVIEALIMKVSIIFPQSSFDIIGYASLWVIGEWLLTLGSLAFPWGNTAVSMTGFLPYLQTASLLGKYFITFITAAACCAFAYAAHKKMRIYAVIGASIICVNSILGSILWFIPNEKSEPIKVSAIQGNVLSNEKWVSGNSATIFDRYVSMTEDAAKNDADIIILPETAIPTAFREGNKLHLAFADIAIEHNVTIITGVRYLEDGNEYNSCIAILPDGTVSERYDKRHLVPFGEFMPFAETLGELFSFIGEFNVTSSPFAEGTDAVVLDAPNGKIAPLVCFDSIFPQFAREGAENGASMFAVVTNDSWFNDSTGIYTHLRHSQIRAIENGRYVLRAANTGISAFVDNKGKIITQTEALTETIANAEIYSIESDTLYTKIGDIIIFPCFAIIFTYLILYIRRSIHGEH